MKAWEWVLMVVAIGGAGGAGFWMWQRSKGSATAQPLAAPRAPVRKKRKAKKAKFTLFGLDAGKIAGNAAKMYFGGGAGAAATLLRGA